MDDNMRRKSFLEEGNQADREEFLDEIQDALEEKRIRETQNLDLNLRKDKLCAEMRKIDMMNDILNSTSHNQTGCPMNPNIVNTSSYTPNQIPTEMEAQINQEPVHGDDCHCSKCCPNPNPNFFQKHKTGLLMGIMWVAIVILAVGISPSGAWFETIQNSWVELIVNFFKMGIFAIAGFASYYLLKTNEKDN